MLIRKSIASAALLCFLAGSTLATAANSFTSMYDEAIAHPKGVDAYLAKLWGPTSKSELAQCAALASKQFQLMATAGRNQYANCSGNSECTAIAKENRIIDEVIGNLDLIARYIESQGSASPTPFLNSEAGRTFATRMQAMKNATGLSDEGAAKWMRNTPVYYGVLRTLELLPCK